MMVDQNPQKPGDVLTVLTSAGPRLTKVWDSATGKIQPYDKVFQVSVAERYVANIYELGALLDELEPMRNSCIIRGRFVGHAKAAELMPEEQARELKYKKKALQLPKEGYALRRKTFFKDQPLHYFYIDIDKFKPDGVDPVLEPEKAINQYIAKHLPACFQGVTYHWQLSSGAGHPNNPGVLKAHVAFWLSAPALGDDLEAWVKAEDKPIDVTVFRTVQPNYTAAPVFINGAVDPVPCRSGLCEGWAGDEVDLVIDPAILMRARAERKSRAEMVDPRDKDNDIGLFCRTFEIEDVVERWLPEVFEFVTETRLTWLLSDSGAAEGAGVTDNRQGVFNTHNGDPFQGRAANKWDLVRHYKFGHLDAGMDAFELLNIQDRPSQAAMKEFVKTLPEMHAANVEERSAGASEFIEAITADIESATTARVLELDVAQRVSQERSLGDADRATIANLLRNRLRALGAPVEIGQIRQWLRPRASANALFADTNDEGHPLGTLENLEILLDQLGVVVRYNVVAKQTEILIPETAYTRDNKDNVAIARILSECERVRMSTKYTQQFLLSLGDANLYNPVTTWITSTPWDGVERLNDFTDTVIADPSEISPDLKRMLVRKWMLQAVAAATSPDGIAGQGVLTFTGPQNSGKTTWFKNLAPKDLELVLTGHTLDVKSKDSQLTALKYWIVELGEVDATFRKSDVSALKSFVTAPVDNIRRPYAATESNYGRRTVFGASVNDEQFLADKSGNRRFWTVPVLGFKFDHGIDMQQVWAECLVILQAGGDAAAWNLNPDELNRLNSHNESFEVTDPIAERIASYWAWDTDPLSWGWLTATDVLMQLGFKEPKKQDTISAGAALKKLNGGRRRKSNGRVLFAVPGVQHAATTDFLS